MNKHVLLFLSALPIVAVVACGPPPSQNWNLTTGGAGAGGDVDIASLPEIPVTSDAVPVPAAMGKLVVATRAKIIGVIAPGDDEQTALRACRQLTTKFLGDIGFPHVVEETAPHDVVFEFSCTSGVVFRSNGTVTAIVPPGAGKPSLLVYDGSGAVLDSFVRSHAPMRCPAVSGDEQARIVACGKAYGMMADAQIAARLGNNQKLLKLANAKG